MLINELSPKIYDLIELMLQQQSSLGDVPIIEAYGNAPRPSDVYITFDPNPNPRQLGREIKIDQTDTDPLCHVTEWEVNVTLREIGSYGEYLQLIQHMQYDQDVMKYLHEQKIAIMRMGQVIPTPRLLDDDKWERESAMEMILAITHVTTDETTYIENVELNNNIGE
jgi:hypothetical protein